MCADVDVCGHTHKQATFRLLQQICQKKKKWRQTTQSTTWCTTQHITTAPNNTTPTTHNPVLTFGGVTNRSTLVSFPPRHPHVHIIRVIRITNTITQALTSQRPPTIPSIHHLTTLSTQHRHKACHENTLTAPTTLHKPTTRLNTSAANSSNITAIDHVQYTHINTSEYTRNQWRRKRKRKEERKEGRKTG